MACSRRRWRDFAPRLMPDVSRTQLDDRDVKAFAMADEQTSTGQSMAAVSLMWLAAAFLIDIDAVTVVGVSVFLTSVGGIQVWRHWRLRRSIHAIRSLTRENRIAVLAAVGSDPMRMFLELELRGHGEPDVGGPVERFHVSPVDQREVENLAYVLFGVAVVGATLPLVLEVANAVRIVVWTCSGATFIASWRFLARTRWYRQSYEVSAFGLRAIVPDSQSRMLRWVDGVCITDRPRLSCIEFRSTDNSISIHVPYRVVGFQRLLEFLVEHLRPHNVG